MGDAERLQIGHHGSGGVEIEIRRQLQAVGRDRDRRGHFAYPMRQSTVHGGTLSPNSLPQIRVPAAAPGAWLMVWSDRLASRRSVAPSPIRQSAVSKPSSAACAFAEGCAGQSGDDLLLADSQQVSHQRQPLSSRGRLAFIPVEHRGVASSKPPARQGPHRHIPHRPRPIRRGGPCGRHRRDRRRSRRRTGRGRFEPHSSPMNSMGMRGAISRTCKRRLDRPRVGVAFEPVAQRAIADLVVVLQEVDEGGRRQMAARLAALAAAKCRGFALIDEAG